MRQPWIGKLQTSDNESCYRRGFARREKGPNDPGTLMLWLAALQFALIKAAPDLDRDASGFHFCLDGRLDCRPSLRHQ
ncbi:hypothetical protein ACFFWD_40050 [Bradyrhizobium erythrophlei]|uniref:hypothetical protein n=1 Tax=Bradyrhizobium erythrophlei TaxID=1437360 RepID=UPI0035ED1B48